MSAKDEAKRLVKGGSVVYLATFGDGGLPDVRAMATVESDGLKTIWMLTGKKCDKYGELSRDPRCLLYATDLGHTEKYLELRLWGTMELLDDDASRSFAWRDDYVRFFPAGKTDPDLCVLKFTASNGTVQSITGKEKFTI